MTISFQTAEQRWASLGPYYAMFPLEFADQVIEEYSQCGQSIIDPFMGRGSSVYSAATKGRYGIGIEINPVCWLYARVKLTPAPKDRVLERLRGLAAITFRPKAPISKQAGEFFDWCYSAPVLRFLYKARENLAWRTDKTDATIMAIILSYLHGKVESALSNQMRQTKAMSPDYSVRWWKERGYGPPEIDPIDFLVKRIEWRYAKGVPSTFPNHVILGDCTKKLRKLSHYLEKQGIPKFSLLFTSPPYSGLTNYHYDQWLRLWMLGGPDHPAGKGDYSQGRFEGKKQYIRLLESTFSQTAETMKRKATIYVRTDARPFTLQSTINALKKAFPKKDFELIQRPYTKKTQTSLFGDDEQKPGEIDIIMRSS